MRGTPGPRVSSLLASSTRYKVYGKEEDTTKVILVETQKVSQPEPEERTPQSNKTQDTSLPRDAVSALVFHICNIWKLWGADALSMSNDHLASSVKVGCIEDGRNSRGRFEAQDYPILKHVRNGEFSPDYNGPREVAEITKYKKNRVGSASKETIIVAEGEATLGKSDAVMCESEAADSTIQQTFVKTTTKHGQCYILFHTNTDEVTTKLG